MADDPGVDEAEIEHGPAAAVALRRPPPLGAVTRDGLQVGVDALPPCLGFVIRKAEGLVFGSGWLCFQEEGRPDGECQQKIAVSFHFFSAASKSLFG